MLAGNHEVHQSSAGMLVTPISQSPKGVMQIIEDGKFLKAVVVAAQGLLLMRVADFGLGNGKDSQSEDSMVNDVSPSCNL